MRDIIAGSGGLNDPRHEIETFFGPGATDVQEMADKEIKRIDELADEKSNDPLQPIGRFALWFFTTRSTASGSSLEKAAVCGSSGRAFRML